MKKDNFFSCMECHQVVISKKKEIKKCPKCGGRFVIDIVPFDISNLRIGAITV